MSEVLLTDVLALDARVLTFCRCPSCLAVSFAMVAASFDERNKQDSSLLEMFGIARFSQAINRVPLLFGETLPLVSGGGN